MDKTSLGDRMKKFERAFKYALPPRMPFIIRVDGKAFHTLTKGMERPFDDKLIWLMNIVANSLCSEIQGAQLAYVQSDEVSILVHNYKRFESQGWFDNQVQKMASVSAAIASSMFTGMSEKTLGELKIAQFDSRVFVLPESEVCNYFIWRQQDFERNSVQMLARSLYSHRECHQMNNAELQEMCWKKGNNWNDLPIHLRRGRCVTRQEVSLFASDEAWGRTGPKMKWLVDDQIPQFKMDRNYIDQYLVCDDE